MNPRIKAFFDAARGIGHCIATETHARLHLAAMVIVVGLALVLRAGMDDWCWFAICIGFVFFAELINTSLERLADRASPEFHPLVRDAKDTAAGAVLIASIASAIVGIIRFWPLILRAMGA